MPYTVLQHYTVCLAGNTQSRTPGQHRGQMWHGKTRSCIKRCSSTLQISARCASCGTEDAETHLHLLGWQDHNTASVLSLRQLDSCIEDNDTCPDLQR